MKKPSGSLIRQTLIFLGVFVALQLLWSLLRISIVGNWLIEGATVHTAVGAIRLISPDLLPIADGTHIRAAGGGINVANGCEGVEVMFMLIAAMCVAPLSLPGRVLGMLTGVIFVFILNQLRLILMFYAVRIDRQLFETIHHLLGPVLLVALTGLFFAFWLAKYSSYQALSS